MSQASPSTDPLKRDAWIEQRRQARTLAVMLMVSMNKGDTTVPDALNLFFEDTHYATLAEESPLFVQCPEEQHFAYLCALVTLTAAHRMELDGYLQKYAQGWRVDRLSTVTAAILRCAVSEIQYMPHIGSAISINEAVEIAKFFNETEDAPAFVNGVLGSFVRGEHKQETERRKKRRMSDGTVQSRPADS